LLGRCEAAAPAGPDDENQFGCGQKMEEIFYNVGWVIFK
jgi:hypothetical protein